MSYGSTDTTNKKVTITIDTSKVFGSQVCLKFSRNGKTDVMMSEPFYLKVFDPCPKYFKTKDD